MASAMMAACLASASAQQNRRASDILFQYIPSLLKGIRDFSKVKGNPFSFLFHWSLLHVDDWVASNGEIVLMPSYDFSDDLSELVDHGGHVSSKTYTTANPLTAGWYQGHWRVNRRAVRNNGGPEGFKLCLCIFGQTNPGYWGTNQVVGGRSGVISKGCELLCSKTGILRPDAVAEVTFGRNDGLVLSCSDIISTKIVRIGGNMSTPVDIPIDDDSVVVNKYGIFPRSTFDADAMNAQVKKAAESSSTATSAKKTSAPSKKSAKKGSVGKGSSNSIRSHFISSTKKQSSEVAAAKSNSSINRGTSGVKAASSTSLTSYIVASSKSKSHKQRPMAAAKSMLSNNKKRSNDDSDDSDIEIVSSNKASSFRAAKKSKSSLPVKKTTHHSFSSEESEEESCGYKSESDGEEDDDNEVMAGWQGSSRMGKGISVKIDDSFLNQEQIKTLEDKVATAPSLLLAGKLSDADIIICANKAAADNMARYSELPIVKEKWLEHPDHEHITQYAFKRDAGDDEVIDLFDSD